MSLRAEHMGAAPILTGLRVGVVLALGVVVLAVVGLTPSFSWVPEAPFLLVATLVPLLGFAFAGYRSASVSHRVLDGVIASAVAGLLSGAIGGLSYVAFGKPLLNMIVGPVIGAVGGAVVGSIAAFLALRRMGASL
jgi:hypothetical protein